MFVNEPLIGNKRYAFHKYEFVFKVVFFIRARTKHPFGMSAAADDMFFQADADAFVLILQKGG